MSLSLAAMLGLVEELRQRGEAFCLVTMIRTANATSAKAGAKAVVTRDGVLHGFVGGGCIQGPVTRTAMAATQAGAPRLRIARAAGRSTCSWSRCCSVPGS